MNEKQMFLDRWNAETQSTLRVLRAFPAHKGDLKPAEKIRSAKDLMMTFVIEQAIAHGTVAGKIELNGGVNQPLAVEEIIKLFEKGSAELDSKVKAMPESEWESTLDFFVGPGKMGKVRRGDILWFVMSDMIHHRGQLSVYVRIAGGTNPSIYGPTLEEPWF